MLVFLLLLIGLFCSLGTAYSADIDITSETVFEYRHLQLREELKFIGISDQEAELGISVYGSVFDLLPNAINYQFGFNGHRQLTADSEHDSDAFVSELYYDHYIDDLLLAVGRKRVRWGTGYVSSPTDLISRSASPIDPDDKFNEIKGGDILQLLSLGESSSWEVIVLREDEDSRYFSSSALVGRYYQSEDLLDFALVAGIEDHGENVIGGNMSFAVGDSLELHGEILYDSNVPSLVPTIDQNGSLIMDNEASVSTLIGGQWTSSSGINLVVEHLHFSNGLSSKEIMNYRPSGNAGNSSDGVLLGSEYLFVRMAKDDLIKDLHGNLLIFSSLQGGGRFQRLQLQWSAQENYEFHADIYAITGSELTEFGRSNTKSGVSAGIKFTF